MLIPARRRGAEILDDPNVDPSIRERSLIDVTRSNRLLGGLRAAVLEIRAALADAGPRATLLDVGTGLADIPHRATSELARGGVALETIAVDEASTLLVAARSRVLFAVCADARALPFRDRSIDVVTCSQVLHHFEFAGAEQVLKELNRVARHAVVVSDLRRSWIAMIGFWLVSFPLGFHRVTRHDGTLSVLRGFTSRELAQLVTHATGAIPRVRRRLGFRLTARWSPT